MHRTPRDEQIDLVCNLLTACRALNVGRHEFASEVMTKILEQQTDKLIKMDEIEGDLKRIGL